MKLLKNLPFIFIFSLFIYQQLLGDTLISSREFLVTLNLSEKPWISFSDLDFGLIHCASVHDEENPLESTTGSLTLWKPSKGTFYVTVTEADYNLNINDGYTFNMIGQESDNLDTIAFLLNSSYEQNGEPVVDQIRTLFPGSIVLYSCEKDKDKKILIDLWASLIYNEDLKSLKNDLYTAKITLNLYSSD